MGDRNRFNLSLGDGHTNAVFWLSEQWNTKPGSLLRQWLEAKLNELIELGQIPKGVLRDDTKQYKSIAELVMHRFALLQDSRIGGDRLNALMQGDRPNDLEIAYLAIALGWTIEDVEALASETNGKVKA